MDTDGPTVTRQRLRGTDSNTLLRLYDRAHERSDHPQSQQDKVRADRALQRIVKELRKRKHYEKPCELRRRAKLRKQSAIRKARAIGQGM